MILLGLSKFSTFGDVEKYFSEDIELPSENEFSFSELGLVQSKQKRALQFFLEVSIM